jgi:hypothetical protein
MCRGIVATGSATVASVEPLDARTLTELALVVFFVTLAAVTIGLLLAPSILR